MWKRSKKQLEATAYHDVVPLTLRRPHRPLKRFTIQRDKAFQLALRLTMRRILATFAVVGAFLFSAGSAWADMGADPAQRGNYADGVEAYNRADYATAFREIRPLAEQGDAKAQFTLGVMYDNGKGVPENDAEAVKWFRKAAEQGNASAQSTLGIMYVLGIGVPEDYVKAHMWFSLAKAEGHEGAAKSLDLVKKQMNTDQTSEAQKLAAEMREKHNN